MFFTPKNQREEALQARLKFNSTDGDHLTLYNVFRYFQKNNYDPKWCIANFLNDRTLQKAQVR